MTTTSRRASSSCKAPPHTSTPCLHVFLVAQLPQQEPPRGSALTPAQARCFKHNCLQSDSLGVAQEQRAVMVMRGAGAA
eukprot:CAMPEP_0171102618 /NCGR_PEP_ID=MMETSP0766_2-20121228/58277_1 /TAXON_ID=439317 /ORGANISM="Gambierdiscus australes, Strain CAWD 149" /LENGTH=78 /DNA_ID=CAMNT_0011562941 /DNA_START=13 /DNA_END=246 /DNA_ORIENTATION=-